MKQLYIIGILIAVVLIALFGLSKLVDRAGESNPAAVAESADTQGENEASEAVGADEVSPDPITNEPMTGNIDEITTITLKTNKGDILIDLFTGKMPITTENFLKLARDNFYDGVKFHRVIDGFMIQGGDPLTKDDSQSARWGTGGPGYSIKDEFGEGLSNVRGTLAMANAGPNTGGSQFFINTVDNAFLDSKHPVFGRVTAGMEIVDTISTSATGSGDMPLEAIVIEDVIVP